MTFDRVNRYADEHDVILVGYRGVDGSVRLDCPEVGAALKQNTDLLSEETSQAYADAYGPARTGSPPRVSISPATASPRRSTIWRPRARRSATTGSIC
jgi:hypothetical protein